ncbi:hypothetical protein AB0E90_36190, partial [Actinoplanes sp. NPDC026619]
MPQLQFFTRSELAAMRDRTKSRNYSAEADEFRREHARHRKWGLARRHARKLCRSHGCSAECGAVGLHDDFEEIPPLIWGDETTVARPPRQVPGREARAVRDLSPSREQQPGHADLTDQSPIAEQADRAAPAEPAPANPSAGVRAQAIDHAKVAVRAPAPSQAQTVNRTLATGLPQTADRAPGSTQKQTTDQPKTAGPTLATGPPQTADRAPGSTQKQTTDQPKTAGPTLATGPP